MIQLEFSEAEVKTLNYERYHHPHPRVQRKMEAFWLKSQGLRHKEISRLTGIGSTTLTSYLWAHQTGGLEGVKEVKFYRPASELQAHRGTLEGCFRTVTTLERNSSLHQQARRLWLALELLP